ncbi:MAG: thiol-disulfide isomerase-like thioredoxin [Planctomycetota bacterium]|nr:thiol-disulfide isomerase-like thioredoxin [Planctomycetota bacterium]
MSTSWQDDPRFADHPNMRSARLWIIMALAFVATFMMIRSFSTKSVVGGKADYSWRLTDLDGKPIDLKSFQGRPIFLNIWATWCGPCRQEMPSIAQLASNPKLKDVAFLCVSSEAPQPVKSYVERTKPPMTMLLAADDPPSVFATEGIPATFIIAPDGRIVRSQIGSMEWDDPAVIRLLEELTREAK